MRHRNLIRIVQRCLTIGVLATLLTLVSGYWSIPALANLPQGNPITDGQAILRYALPIDNSAIRDVQSSLEDITNQLRGKRWKPIEQDVSRANRVLQLRNSKILASIPADRKPQAEAFISQLQSTLADLRAATEAKDKDAIVSAKQASLDIVGQLEEAMIEGFPFEIPAEYQSLPQLKGRATIAMTTTRGDLTLVVDGYSAPVTAGNFVDLVHRGFYNNLPFTRAEASYLLQTGDPDGAAAGFIDPDTGEYRAIPLEILAEGDTVPTYGITLEDAGRYLDYPVLPFSAYGALALARPSDDPNGGSSQFFFFLFDSELTPAGANLLDGRYAIFGYVVEGKDVLENLKQGDKIESATVVSGLENLV